MELTSVYHRPESEYAYLYQADTMHLRVRTKRQDVSAIKVYYGDTYQVQIAPFQEALLTKVASSTLFDYWQVAVQVPYRRIGYVFELQDETETILYGDDGYHTTTVDQLQFLSFFRLPYWHDNDRAKVPEWVKSTVWYQIFPERFANGDDSLTPKGARPWDPTLEPTSQDFFGGDLQGILDHLDYLSELGINGLYLCPIFEAPSNHKYDTINYFEIDQHFGDKQVFKQLVEAAHARGMKVMLDAVFNHIGAHSPQWQDVMKYGAASRYANWFHIHQFPVADPDMLEADHLAQGLTYDMFAFVGRMPKFNTTNPEVKAYLLSIATYWIEAFDIDGWRLDVANEVDHQFWREFHQAVTAIKPDLYILGEIWHNAQNWLNGDELHSVMNYLGTANIKRFFLEGSIEGTVLVDSLVEQQFLYRRQMNEVMFNLLDSHDTERMLTTAKGQVHRVCAALACLFLQIGSPCIYYGTEVGVSGEHDPGCRKVMPWDPAEQNLALLAFVKQLIQLRHQYNDIIQYGLVQYEVSGRVVKIQITYQRQQLQAIFNYGQASISLPCQEILLGVGYHTEKSEQVVTSEGFIVYQVNSDEV